MKPYLPISIKRKAAQKLSEVRDGRMSREKAEEMLRHRLRYSSKLREDLIEVMTRNYDEEAVEALKYFRLI